MGEIASADDRGAFWSHGGKKFGFQASFRKKIGKQMGHPFFTGDPRILTVGRIDGRGADEAGAQGRQRR